MPRYRGRKKTHHQTTEEARVNQAYTDDNTNATATAAVVNSNGNHQHSPYGGEPNDEDPTQRRRSVYNAVQGLPDNHTMGHSGGQDSSTVHQEDTEKTASDYGGFQTMTKHSVKRKQSVHKDSDTESLCMELATGAANDDHDSPDHCQKGMDIEESDQATVESIRNELSSGYTSDHRRVHDDEASSVTEYEDHDGRKEATILVTKT